MTTILTCIIWGCCFLAVSGSSRDSVEVVQTQLSPTSLGWPNASKKHGSRSAVGTTEKIKMHKIAKQSRKRGQQTRSTDEIVQLSTASTVNHTLAWQHKAIAQAATGGTNGNTIAPTDVDVLIYTRIPKTGSSSLHELFQKSPFCTVGFNSYRDYYPGSSWSPEKASVATQDARHIFVQENRSQGKKFDVAREISRHKSWNAFLERRKAGKQVYVLDDHIRYDANLTWEALRKSTGMEKQLSVKFMSIVREPVARLISSYYYLKDTGSRNATRADQVRNTRGDQMNLTFSECIALPRNERRCVRDHFDVSYANMLTAYLCGFAMECGCVGKGARTDCSSAETRAAVETAIRNVREKFAFVGVLEDNVGTLKLLRHIFPDLRSTFAATLPTRRVSKKSRKPETQAAIEAAREFLWPDIDVYKFTADLFKEKLRMLGILEGEIEKLN